MERLEVHSRPQQDMGRMGMIGQGIVDMKVRRDWVCSESFPSVIFLLIYVQ